MLTCIDLELLLSSLELQLVMLRPPLIFNSVFFAICMKIWHYMGRLENSIPTRSSLDLVLGRLENSLSLRHDGPKFC